MDTTAHSQLPAAPSVRALVYQGLSDRQATVWLARQAGLDQETIASLLDCQPETVGVHAHRARDAAPVHLPPLEAVHRQVDTPLVGHQLSLLPSVTITYGLQDSGQVYEWIETDGYQVTRPIDVTVDNWAELATVVLAQIERMRATTWSELPTAWPALWFALTEYDQEAVDATITSRSEADA